MSHFEKVIFRPNEETFELEVAQVKNFIQKYRRQLEELNSWIKDSPSERIIQWEIYNQKSLASVYPGSVESLKLSTNPLLFGNGSELVIDKTNQTLTWTNTNPIYSKDCLLFMDMIQNYKLWQLNSYATHQIGKGAQKRLKTYGWKNINYKKWFKKSTKI